MARAYRHNSPTKVVEGDEYYLLEHRTPAHYRRCHVILKDGRKGVGFRYDTGFEKEWTTNFPEKIIWDESVDCWRYVN
jgi:hypothetical protein